MTPSPIRRMVPWLLPALLLLPFVAPADDAPSWEQLQAFYAYDVNLPLDATIVGTEDMGVHGLGGSRNDITKIAAPLICPMGIAVMAIDAQYHGDRKIDDRPFLSPDIASVVAAFRQTIIDNRRALDYVAGRDDLDSDRVVLLGLSLGSIMGSIVASLDTRLNGAFLVVGGGDLAGLFAKSQIDDAKRLREELGDMEPFRAALAFVEPVNFAAHIAPRPVVMVNGKDDEIVIADCAQALFDAAKEPKKITWYEGSNMRGHIPPLDLVFRELKAFLVAQNFIVPAASQTQGN